MKKIKRTFTFILALIVSVSFMMHSFVVSAEWRDFSSPGTEFMFFDDNSNRSYGWAFMTVAGDDEGYTNLKAETFAENIYLDAYDYNDYNQHYIAAEVTLSVTYEDFSGSRYSDFNACDDNWTCGGVYAEVECTSPTPECYSIITFTSGHYMYIVVYEDGVPVPIEQYGPSLYIGISY